MAHKTKDERTLTPKGKPSMLCIRVSIPPAIIQPAVTQPKPGTSGEDAISSSAAEGKEASPAPCTDTTYTSTSTCRQQTLTHRGSQRRNTSRSTRQIKVKFGVKVNKNVKKVITPYILKQCLQNKTLLTLCSSSNFLSFYILKIQHS